MPQYEGRTVEIPLSGAQVLVAGATGFIGRHLVAELLDRGSAVSVLTRSRNTAPPPVWATRVTWYELDGDQATLSQAVGCASVIFNLAGSSGAVASNRNPIESLDANCRFQLRLLQAIERGGHRPHVVFASSRLVYAPNGRTPVSENQALAPRSVYAAHKLCVEHYHQIFSATTGMTFSVCRISNPFGIDEDCWRKGYGFVNTLIRNALSGLPMTLFGTGQQLRDYLYITDLVDALVRCGIRAEARNQIFNIGRGVGLSVHDAALLIQQGTHGSIHFRSWPPEYQDVESGDYVADISKAREQLGFHPQYDFAAGLSKIFAELTFRPQAVPDAAVSV